MDISDVPPWPVYSQAARSAVSELVRTGTVFDYSGRQPVTELEIEFGALHQAAHVVTFNSGTSALFAALSAVGVSEGDEVIVPDLTFLASASPLLWLGATPVLVDSAHDEPSIGAEEIEAALTTRTRAVVVTHLFGNPVDIFPIADICAARGIRLIEDCSHAHASTIGSSHVGTFGDAAIYSIGASKPVSGGHGGVLITKDSTIRDLAMLIGQFKPRTRTDLITEELRPYAEFALGGNLRLSPLSAALALDHLRSLESLADARCANVAALDEALRGLLIPVRSPAPRVNRSHYDIVYTLPQEIPTSARSALLSALKAAGLPVGAPSTRPLSRVLRAFPAEVPLENTFLRRLHETARSAHAAGKMPNSERQHDRMISFPAGKLYLADTRLAHAVGETAQTVVSAVFGGDR